MKTLLALGDCNTEGDILFKGNSFPERFSKLINHHCVNCGYTMSTTKEMLNLYDNRITNDVGIILIQFGLVDSWKTFKYAPYVLYYPDNFLRKFFRKVVKKYKKTTRALGLDKLLGSKYVVSPDEYRKNIETIVSKNKDIKVILIDTIPNHETFRNESIQFYNSILSEISDKYENCYKLNIYDDFEKKLGQFYLDKTHINENGYSFIVEKLYRMYIKW